MPAAAGAWPPGAGRDRPEHRRPARGSAMSRFNRVLAVLLLAATFAGALIVLLISMKALAPQALLPAQLREGPLAQWLSSFTQVSTHALLLNVAISLATLALAGMLLFL